MWRRGRRNSLGEVGLHRPQEAVAGFRRALRRDEPTLTQKVLYELARYEEATSAALPELRELVETSQRDDLASEALARIAEMGEGAKEAEDLLREQFASDHPQRRFLAAVALSRFDSGGDVLTELVRALETGEPHEKRRNLADVRMRAARALGDMGPAAEPAVGDLLAALRVDPEAHLNEQRAAAMAARALGRIGAMPEQVVPRLIKVVESDEGKVAPAAAAALGEFGEQAAPAVNLLIERGYRNFLSEEYAKALVSEEYAKALAGIGEPAVDPLVAALRSGDRRRGMFAAEVLGMMGERAVLGRGADEPRDP